MSFCTEKMQLNSNTLARLLSWNSHALMRSSAICLLAFSVAADAAGSAWFIDGYHGGVYGHYPTGYTGFIVEQLKNNPGWRINLEIEPETWDSVRIHGHK